MNRGDLSLAEAEAALDDFRARLDPGVRGDARERRARAAGESRAPRDRRDLAADRRRARGARPGRARRSSPGPRTSRVNPKLERILQSRRTEFDAGVIDWALAEALALRLARPRGHAGAAGRPGHPARHVQPASRRARRHAHRERVLPARARLARPGAVHALRLGAVRVRRARLRVRLLGGGPAGLGRLGGAVRRLHERRPDHHRPVRRRGGGQVGADARASRCCSPTASKARDPSTRARGSNGSSRCVPRTTCASSTPRPPRSTSTCCGASRARERASRSSASRRSGTCA